MLTNTRDRHLHDPIALELVWGRLTTIADEMATTVVRTSFSTVVGTSGDFACQLLDSHGAAVVHSKRVVPLFRETMANVGRHIVATYHGDIHEGDVFLTNDPWLNSGHHGDVAILTPFFCAGELGGFAASVAHVSDIGGTLYADRATESYEEGILLPPCRLYRAGTRNDELLAILRANVRVPENVVGDVMALVNANAAATTKVTQLLRDYGIERFDSVAADIHVRSEAAMRSRIEALPDGTWTSEVRFREYDRDLLIRCSLTVVGDEIHIDFTGSSPQQPRGGINVGIVYVRAQVGYCVQSLLLPDVPGNAGVYRPISVTAPVGSLLNCRPPATTRLRQKSGWNVHPAIHKALLAVLPDSVMAAAGQMASATFYARGVDGSTSQSWMFNGGGLGARSFSDGASCMTYPSAVSNIPVELLELAAPVVVWRKELRVDSGGAGTRRGGLGQTVEVEVHPEFDGDCVLSPWIHCKNSPPAGLAGGFDGAPGSIVGTGSLAARQAELDADAAIAFRAGDGTIVIGTAGGGGYGSPADRASDAVATDVAAGFVSAEAARAIYGWSAVDDPQ